MLGAGIAIDEHRSPGIFYRDVVLRLNPAPFYRTHADQDALLTRLVGVSDEIVDLEDVSRVEWPLLQLHNNEKPRTTPLGLLRVHVERGTDIADLVETVQQICEHNSDRQLLVRVLLLDGKEGAQVNFTE